MLKVCKFGGTSMADAKAIKQVASIINADKDRRYVVVSAPGKRFKEDIKVTDLLIKCYNDVLRNGDCKETFAIIRERFEGIVKDLGIDFDIKSVLDETEKEIIENSSIDFSASRGEYLMARVFAAYMNVPFVDAKGLIRFDSKGRLNESYTYDKTKMKLEGLEMAVIPGFYGKNSQGNIKTFSRGGSDITGSLIARAMGADIYENWTDVNGFLVCDPRVVANPKVIKYLSYQELRELSYMGASVLHSEAIFPLVKSKIPVNIRNTFDPTQEGTMIVPNDYYANVKPDIITGIAGLKDFTVIYIEKSLMNEEVGFVRKVLSVIEQHGICFENIPSGIDTISIVIASKALENGVLNDVVSEIRESVSPDFIRVIENISLIATVGHGMATKAGVAAKLFNALAKENINIKMIDQGSSELNIIIGVSNSDYEKSIKAIYNEFID